MAKRRSNGQMSESELETRRFHKEVRDARKACEEMNIALLSFDDALNDDVCVLSMNEYEIGATKQYLDEANEPYFVHEQNFNETQTLLDYAQFCKNTSKYADVYCHDISFDRLNKVFRGYRAQCITIINRFNNNIFSPRNDIKLIVVILLVE